MKKLQLIGLAALCVAALAGCADIYPVTLSDATTHTVGYNQTVNCTLPNTATGSVNGIESLTIETSAASYSAYVDIYLVHGGLTVQIANDYYLTYSGTYTFTDEGASGTSATYEKFSSFYYTDVSGDWTVRIVNTWGSTVEIAGIDLAMSYY